MITLKPKSKGIWTWSKKSLFSSSRNRFNKFSKDAPKPNLSFVPSFNYFPQPKAPSRRDKRRMEVAQRKH